MSLSDVSVSSRQAFESALRKFRDTVFNHNPFDVILDGMLYIIYLSIKADPECFV